MRIWRRSPGARQRCARPRPAKKTTHLRTASQPFASSGMPGAEIIPLATVLDASVAIRWLAMEPGTAAAVALMRRPTRWVAPRLLLTEVAGAFHRKISERRIRELAATEAL